MSDRSDAVVRAAGLPAFRAWEVSLEPDGARRVLVETRDRGQLSRLRVLSA